MGASLVALGCGTCQVSILGGWITVLYDRDICLFAASQDFAGLVCRAGGEEVSASSSERSSVLKVGKSP